MKRMMMFAAFAAACGGGSASQPDDSKDGKAEAKVEAKPEGKKNELQLTPAQLATAKLEIAPTQKRSEAAAIRATGEIEPPDDGVAKIGPKVAGRVARLLKGVGDSVKKGELLATIDSPDLGRAKADYIAAAAATQVTKESAEREKALFDKKISSEKDWRQAEADATRARAERDAAEVRLHTLGISDAQLTQLNPGEHFAAAFSVASPIEGVVVERPITVGQLAQPQDTMFTVMNLGEVWVLADIYERDLSQVAVGQRVIARVPAWKDREFPGTVASIGAVLERKSRAVKIRVVLPNPSGALKPGMFATVEVAGVKGAPHTAVYVPSAAVQRDGERSLVFVAKGKGMFEVRKVEVGTTSNGWTEIENGVAENESVVSTGSFALKSELNKDALGEED